VKESDERAVDQFSQVIDVFPSARRDTDAARRFFGKAIKTTKVTPVEVVTDQAAASSPTPALYSSRPAMPSQNLRRGHYELAVDEPIQLRVAVAFDELRATI
jgi:transposase-like protein